MADAVEGDGIILGGITTEDATAAAADICAIKAATESFGASGNSGFFCYEKQND